jgi:hypothetical protein
LQAWLPADKSVIPANKAEGLAVFSFSLYNKDKRIKLTGGRYGRKKADGKGL